jgi:hypothetical protein
MNVAGGDGFVDFARDPNLAQICHLIGPTLPFDQPDTMAKRLNLHF